MKRNTKLTDEEKKHKTIFGHWNIATFLGHLNKKAKNS